MADEQTVNANAAMPTPEEVHELLSRHLEETERLAKLLHEGLEKGEEQLRALKAFDAEIAALGKSIEPIDVAAVETGIDNVRKHLLSLDELRGHIRSDIGKVEQISAKISEILAQYGRKGSS